MKHLFLDTNVIIDLLIDRKPFSEPVTQLFEYAEKGKLNLYISALSYSNIYYIVRKTCTHRQMLSLLRDLEAITATLDVTKQIITDSLNTGFKDFEDAIQYNTAISNKKITAIVTRDAKGFKNDAVAVFTPGEALSIIENTGNLL
jgi:predicted nucleic acid-binding protein